jgi:hypothetical protein
LKDFGTARRCIVSLNNHLKGTDACAGTPELHVPNLIFPITRGERLELYELVWKCFLKVFLKKFKIFFVLF